MCMWAWIVEHPKDFAEIVALASAALFFLYKAITGYLRANLSLSVRCVRLSSGDRSTDRLAISMHIAKGTNGSVALHDASARITVDGQTQVHSFPGTLRSERVKGCQRSSINWSKIDESSPLLKLVPGEETELALLVLIPSSAICLIEVAVLGRRVSGLTFGQWKASAVSTPRPYQKEEALPHEPQDETARQCEPVGSRHVHESARPI